VTEPDESAIGDLARARRRRRVADADWFEQLYRAYLTVFACGMVALVAASFIGDDEVQVSSMHRIGELGPPIVGAICAAALLVGARSGGRGGPLALEAAYVQHVLLAPVDRDEAMRGPAMKLLVQSAITGGVAGGLAGLVASERLLGSTGALVAGGAAAGAAIGIAAVGMAMVFAGRRLNMWAADALLLPLAAGSAYDIAHHTAYSPATWFGRLALDAVHGDVASSIGAVAVAAVLAGAGLLVVGDTSLEASIRRASLVSSLRFAVTRQDLRTVVLLQRRLAQDRARARPWLPFTPPGRGAAWRRDWQGLLRLPARRVARMAVLGAIAVGAGWAVWQGTLMMVVLVGLAMHALALDVIEPYAQELDHPTLWGSFREPPGKVLLRHLPAPMTAIVLAAVPVVVVIGIVGGGKVAAVAAVTAVVGAIGSVVGAAATVATPPFESSTMFVSAPEAVGMQVVFRLVWPIIVTILSVLPVLAARAALHQGQDPVAASTGTLPFLAIPIAAAGTWLNARRPIRL
jgi:hypothetical protein